MANQEVNEIFYERNFIKENLRDNRYTWIATVIIFAWCFGLVFFIGLKFSPNLVASYEINSLKRESPQIHRLPLVPGSLAHVHDLLQHISYNCKEWKIFDHAPMEPGESSEGRWRLGTSVCLDQLPSKPTAANCRIYATGYDELDIYFEMQMAEKGCRVHVWGNKTTMNYAVIAKNIYFYPLDIGIISTKNAVYSYDDFLDLLGHKNKEIHIVKSTILGSEWKLLKALMASKLNSWINVRQIHMIVHLPKLTLDTWRDVEDDYRNLVGLVYLGFKLALSRRNPRYQYELPGFKEPFSTMYEMVWIK